MTRARFERIKTMLTRRQTSLTVIADYLHKSHNIAAIARSCDAFGVHRFHVTRGETQFRKRHRTAGGSLQWLDLQLHDHVTDAIHLAKNRGMKVYAAHLSDRAVDYRKVDYTVPCAILMGNEKDGVRGESIELADEHIVVPMEGMVESFNVSVACALILGEARNQRHDAGLYDGPRQIPDDEYNQLLFQWMLPKMARYCDERNIPYPPLDEDGDILNPSEWYASIRQQE